MKREIRMPEREPIRGWRIALVVTKSNEVVIDREDMGDQELIALLTRVAAMIQDQRR